MESSSSSAEDAIRPSLLDIQRAVFCSACTYKSFEFCRKELQESNYSDLGFIKVLLGAKVQSNAHNLVVAVAADDSLPGVVTRTLYVALRGTKCLQDMLTDLDTTHASFEVGLGLFEGAVAGAFHSGFVRRIGDQLPDMSYFKMLMVAERADRIVFCGHSLGGALAHMALIQYVFRVREAPDSKHISISFGSPHFCNIVAKDDLKKQGLEKRMFTYVNEGDPLPLLFNNMRVAMGAAVQYAIKRFGRSLSVLSEWLYDESNCVQDERSISSWAKDLERCRRAIIATATNQNEDTPFAPVGRYHRLGDEESKLITDMREIEITCAEKVVIDAKTLRCHKAGAYLWKLVRRSAAASDELGSIVTGVHEVNPQVESCIMILTGGQGEQREARIYVKGKDLFLPLKWEVSGMPGRWHLEKYQDFEDKFSMLVLKYSAELSPGVVSFLNNDGKMSDTGDTSPFTVSIQTCFGSIREHKVLMKNPWFGSCVKSALARIISKLLLVKSCSDTSDARHNMVQDIDGGVLKPVMRLGEKEFSLKLSSGWKRDVREERRRLSREFVMPVMQALTRQGVPQKVSWSNAIVMAGGAISVVGLLTWAAVAMPVTLTIYAAHTAAWSSALSSLSVPAGLTAAAVTGWNVASQELTIQMRYSEILVEILAHLTKDKVELGEEVSYYEEKIHEHIINNPTSLAWLETSTSTHTRNAKDLSQRAHVIHNILSAKARMDKFKTAMFIGPENAGKSTLINYVAGAEVAKVGHTYHTKDVHPYMVNDLILVDMPGTEAAGERGEMSTLWEEWEYVADLCVVVVPFTGDTSRAAQEQPKRARRLQCDKVVLVVNGMDRVLHGSKKARVWSEYTKENLESMRIEFAMLANLSPCDVFMSVSSPSDELEDTTLQSLQERGVMLGEEITIILRKLILDNNHT